MSKKVIIQDKYLRYLYEVRELTDNEIAKKLGIGFNIIKARRKEYRISSRSISESQNSGICQNCGEDGSNVVHHIHPRRSYQDVNNSNVLVNLTLLCKRCHRIIDAKLRWHRKEGEVRESLKQTIAMVTLSQVLSEMVRKVQRLMDEAKSRFGYAYNFQHERPPRKG